MQYKKFSLWFNTYQFVCNSMLSLSVKKRGHISYTLPELLLLIFFLFPVPVDHEENNHSSQGQP
jgi:hypothetical protein